MEKTKKTVKCTPSVMKTCMYGDGYNSGSWHYCDYLDKTGNRRGCKPECCDKYEKKKKENNDKCKTKTSIYW